MNSGFCRSRVQGSPGGRRRGGSLGAGHVGLAERDGQLQVLLLLPPQPRQPLLLRSLALALGPRQLLLLIAKLKRKRKPINTLTKSWSECEKYSETG